MVEVILVVLVVVMVEEVVVVVVVEKTKCYVETICLVQLLFLYGF